MEFKHKLSKNEDKEEIVLVEHFIPYSAEVLLENKFISEELYDLLCDVTIGNLSKLFESENVTSDSMNSDWINIGGSYEKKLPV